jgi:hypothetical protein
MAKDSNIVHRYFKKKFDDTTILVKVNPVLYKGIEIRLTSNNPAGVRELDFDEEIWDDLKIDGFEDASPLEFNLYYSGLIK